MVQPEGWNEIFEAMSDSEVIDWAISRIEQEDWTGCLDGLNGQEKDFVRVTRFQGIFGNGGLEYFFECDQYGQDTVGSLRRLGLIELAELLDRVFAYVPRSPGCRYTIDLDQMIQNKDPVFAGLEEAAWEHFDSIAPVLANFIRRNSGAFAHLKDRKPYDPISK